MKSTKSKAKPNKVDKSESAADDKLKQPPLSKVLSTARNKLSPQQGTNLSTLSSSTPAVNLSTAAVANASEVVSADESKVEKSIETELKTADPIVIALGGDEDEKLKALGLFSGGVKAGQELSAEENKQKTTEWYANNPFFKRSMMHSALNRLSHEFWTKPCKIACWFCGYKFHKLGLNPIPMPVKYQQSVFTVEGVYCSFTCVKSKIMLDPGYYLNERLECLTLMLRDVYCYYEDVTTVCREIFKRYGGDVSHKQYLADQAVTGMIKVVGSPFVQAPTIIENGFVDVLLQRPKIIRPPPVKSGTSVGSTTPTSGTDSAKTNGETLQAAPVAHSVPPTSSLLSPSFTALGFKPAQLSSFYSSTPSASSSSSSTSNVTSTSNAPNASATFFTSAAPVSLSSSPPVPLKNLNFSDMVPTLNKHR